MVACACATTHANTTDCHTGKERNSMQRRKYWQEDAACLGVGAHIFFPTIGKGDCKGKLTRLFAEAKTYCDRCPVTIQCVETQLAVEKETLVFDGMFGGFTPSERRQILSDREWLERTKPR